ncbi:hypothetical protein [Dyella subtropica]|uniref:hypothetical protein n=1 Tax=Dyella subtropica TaxID=2992127 RepID=UPI002255F582|nr:hypothetical protein [Dyella subtropica]
MRSLRSATLTVSLMAGWVVVGCAQAATPAYTPGSYDSQSDIFDAMSGFRTFNGTSLLALLRGHGLRIMYVQVNTVESLGPQDGDMPGDVVYGLQIEGTATGKLPCDLGSIHGTHAAPYTEEFIRRADVFPVPDEHSDVPTGPLMFWAATGRCSKAY